MKATRSDGGYVFHGGCDGCTQPLQICPGCMYMEPNWGLPNLNPVHEEKKMERETMKKLAHSLRVSI